MKRLPLAFALLVIAAGCRKAPVADPAAVVATFTGGTIRRADIADELERRIGKSRDALTPERRRELVRMIVERRVRTTLLLKEAERAGVPHAPRTALHRRVREHAILAADWLQRHVEPKVVVPEERIEKETARVSANKGVESRGFSHIYLRADGKDAQAVARARATMATIRQELADGRAFEDLARAYSDSISARGGGQIGPTLKSQLKEPLAETIFSLAEGQVSAPVETPDGIHLFRVDQIRRPPSPRAEEVRASVAAELRGEALRAATDAERARAVDESGVTIAESALAPGAAPSDVVMEMEGPLTRGDLDDLMSSRMASGATRLDAARWLLANWQLARRRRQEPVDDALARRLASGDQDVVASHYREILVKAAFAPVTPEEEAAFWEKGKDTLPFLRQKEVDILFLPQHGDDVAGLYRQGEAVSHALRAGTSFDDILGGSSRPRDAVAVRKVATSSEAVRRASLGVFRAFDRLRKGEVSPAVYVQEDSLAFSAGAPITRGHGLLFLRLVDERAMPFDEARPSIRPRLEEQKRGEAIAAIKRRLDQEAHLTILQPEG